MNLQNYKIVEYISDLSSNFPNKNTKKFDFLSIFR